MCVYCAEKWRKGGLCIITPLRGNAVKFSFCSDKSILFDNPGQGCAVRG